MGRACESVDRIPTVCGSGSLPCALGVGALGGDEPRCGSDKVARKADNLRVGRVSIFSLAGKRALVTGAGSGIGEAIVKTFAAAGAAVMVVDVNDAAGRQTVEKVNADGGEAVFRQMDVSDAAACNHLASEVIGSDGRLDILVNNAGIGHVGTILQTEGDDLDRLYRVNVRGIFNLCKAFLPHMIEVSAGNIINLASIGGVVAVRDRLAYCTTKFAVVGLTKSIALDHAKQGIRCNCICPGRVETPFVTARLKEYADPEAAYQKMASTQALGRMAKPLEIAHAALYLAADESSFVTGTDFLIDGGWSAGK
ncbi:MAG: Dihydroanticapsin 7-dehydrogenase [Verrucomicrobia subdivision 3 bacterium]|nr:Dihydroanticapsin 7-dehydrogenase [Limisphaerales bacterium]MCS1414471.1 Dihydroanticapsin 7-dehydrogenase [Limisphaerales bacterium]